ncbi:MAG: glycosyltransferase [Acetobacteraceae bacterium]
MASLPRGSRVHVVDDAGPDPALGTALDGLARAGRIRLIRQPRNCGFSRCGQCRIDAAAGRDVVLLNSDTLVPPGWIEALAEAAYARAGYRLRLPAVERRDHPQLPRLCRGQPHAQPGRDRPARCPGAAGERGRHGGHPGRSRLLHVHPPRLPRPGRQAAGGSVRPRAMARRTISACAPATRLASCGGAGRLRGACRRRVLRHGPPASAGPERHHPAAPAPRI